jgi:hypothetical protein
VSEGDPENWVAVAWAISDRVRELGWCQRELAARSHAPVTIAGNRFPQPVYRRARMPVIASWTSGHADALCTRSAVPVHLVFPAVAAPWTW